jgi:tetratricopeptide (TPR) repeat protein
LQLCALLERKPGDEAADLAAKELQVDPFNFGVLFEQARGISGDYAVFHQRMRRSTHNYIQLASDYTAAGLDGRASEVLQSYIDGCGGDVNSQQCESLLLYHLALVQRRLGHTDQADHTLSAAAVAPREAFFPNTLADLAALESAVAHRPDDARGWCDLGNLLFSKRRYAEGIANWERARDLDAAFAQPRRNLGLAYFNKSGDSSAAWRSLTEAFCLDSSDARVLYELDQLAKRLNHDPQERLARLQQHDACVAERDDLTIEKITLLNQLGEHQPALQLLISREFRPWEGGEGKTSAQYVLSQVGLASRALRAGEWREARETLLRAIDWPLSLGEGKLPGTRENNIHYWLGVAARGMGDDEQARQWWRQASQGDLEPTSAQYYNDQPPEMIFYQGLSHEALGNAGQAQARFQSLVEYGESHLEDEVAIDYFAVSLPDFLVFDIDLQLRHQLHCRFMRGLGLLGLRDAQEAEQEFAAILQADVNHMGALLHRAAPLHFDDFVSPPGRSSNTRDKPPKYQMLRGQPAGKTL